MTITIDLSPETEAWLDEEARKWGQAPEIVAKLALEAFAVRQAASSRFFWELWDNEDNTPSSDEYGPAQADIRIK